MTLYAPPRSYRLSHSTCELFRTCPRKFQFHKGFQFAEIVYETQHASETGKAIHEAYQEYLVSLDEDTAFEVLIRNYPLDEEKHSYANSGRSLEACVQTLQKMINTPLFDYSQLASITVDGETKPAIEVPFQINFKSLLLDDNDPESYFTYVGFIDVIMYYMGTNRYLVGDIKSTRRKFYDLDVAYKNSTQCLPYGLVIEAISQEEIRELDVMYLHADIDLVKPQVRQIEFTKTAADIREWLLDIQYIIGSIKQQHHAQYFSRSGSACMNWNMKCKHFDNCKQRDNQFLQDFILAGRKPKKPAPFKPWIEVDINLE